MDIRMNGVNQSTPQNTDPSVNLEKERIQLQKTADQKKVVREELKKDEVREEQEKKPVVEPTKFVMSDLDMKELLLMMGSRGSSKQIETLVAQAKKARDIFNQK